MRQLALSRSILVFWQDLVFLEAALSADDATQDLATLLTPVLNEFSQVLQLDLDTRRTVLRASARAYVADASIDDGVRGLFSAVLALVGQDRKRPEFTTLFSSHIGDVVRHALKRQVEVTVALVDKLTLKLFPADLQTAQTTSLNSLVALGKIVLEEVRQAALTRVEGRIDIQEWKEEANAARLTVYGQLLALAAKTGRKKAWAEGFFRAAAAGIEAEATAEDEAPEPAPAAEPSPPA